MRIYLNTSALSRPFDDLSQSRTRLEADAVAGVIQCIEIGAIELISSEYLMFELSQHPDENTAQQIATPLRLATKTVKASASLVLRARSLEQFSLRGLDALHVASAEAGEAELLVTTDDRMVKRARRARSHLKVRVVSPARALVYVAEGTLDEE